LFIGNYLVNSTIEKVVNDFGVCDYVGHMFLFK
jgi:hypothetical protein